MFLAYWTLCALPQEVINWKARVTMYHRFVRRQSSNVKLIETCSNSVQSCSTEILNGYMICTEICFPRPFFLASFWWLVYTLGLPSGWTCIASFKTLIPSRAPAQRRLCTASQNRFAITSQAALHSVQACASLTEVHWCFVCTGADTVYL